MAEMNEPEEINVEQAMALERKRVLAIYQITEKFGGRIPDSFRDRAVMEGWSVSEFRCRLFDELGGRTCRCHERRYPMEKIPPFPRLQEPNEAAVDAWWRSHFDEMRANVERAAAELEEATREVKAELRRSLPAWLRWIVCGPRRR